MKHLLFLFILTISLSIFAQEKTRLLLSLDRKSSLFNSTHLNTLGLRIGYKYGCKVNVGFGVYNANNIGFDYALNPANYPNTSNRLDAKLTYVTAFVEPIILAESRKVFSIPVSIGGGNLKVKYRELYSTTNRVYMNDFVPVVDVAGVFMFKTIPLIWIGGGIGYRHFFHKDEFVNDSFNSPYFMVKVKVGRPCKEAGAFYKWRKNLFSGAKKEEKKDEKKKADKKKADQKKKSKKETDKKKGKGKKEEPKKKIGIFGL